MTEHRDEQLILRDAVIHRVSERLGNGDISGDLIRQAYGDALDDQPSLGEIFRADIVATVDRDPATSRCLEPVLYYKGFHAIQTHRLAHWLYGKGRKDFALYLQSRSSAVFQCDINPAARIGRGIFLDHATGLVVGLRLSEPAPASAALRYGVGADPNCNMVDSEDFALPVTGPIHLD